MNKQVDSTKVVFLKTFCLRPLICMVRHAGEIGVSLLCFSTLVWTKKMKSQAPRKWGRVKNILKFFTCQDQSLSSELPYS